MKSFLTPVFVAFMWNVQAQECNNLFISEYIEGSSSNKAIELFNPTLSELDLKNYKIELYNNGTVTPTMTFFPKGKIPSGETFVVAHPNSNTALLAKSDTVFGFNFNGNDAVVLVDSHFSDTLDIIGVIGESPANFWSLSNGGSTQNYTLIRKSDVAEGGLWSNSSTTWDTLLVDDFTNVGTHTFEEMLSCSVYDDLVAVKDLQEVKLSFYPNPVIDVLHVEDEGIESVVVYNMLGERLAEYKGRKELDLMFLKSGIYSLVMMNKNGKRNMFLFSKK